MHVPMLNWTLSISIGKIRIPDRKSLNDVFVWEVEVIDVVKRDFNEWTSRLILEISPQGSDWSKLSGSEPPGTR